MQEATRIAGELGLIILEVVKILGNMVALGIGALVAFIFSITGGQDEAMRVLLILMAVDYISGVIKAYITHSANSKLGIIGILKKTMIILVIVLAYHLDCLLGGKLAIKALMVGAFISNEGLSILENSAICGVPIPDKIKKVLVQYQEYKKQK